MNAKPNFDPTVTITYGREQCFQNFKFQPHTKVEQAELNQEIQTRMALFGVDQETIDQTLQGKLFFNYEGFQFEIDHPSDLKFIHDIEKKYDVKIYYATKDTFFPSLDEGYRYFFIGSDKENWKYDQIDIRIQRPMCFKYRILDGKRIEYAEPIGMIDQHKGLFRKERYET